MIIDWIIDWKAIPWNKCVLIYQNIYTSSKDYNYYYIYILTAHYNKSLIQSLIVLN